MVPELDELDEDELLELEEDELLDELEELLEELLLDELEEVLLEEDPLVLPPHPSKNKPPRAKSPRRRKFLVSLFMLLPTFSFL